MASSISSAVTELAATFGGQLLQPADPDYDEARRVHNGLVDKRPALIARCLRVVTSTSQGLQACLKSIWSSAAHPA